MGNISRWKLDPGRIIIAIKSGNSKRFLGASDFLESPPTLSQTASRTVGPPLVLLPSFSLSFSFSFTHSFTHSVTHSLTYILPSHPLSLLIPFRFRLPSTATQSPFLHTDAPRCAQYRHAYTRSSVCMFCGWLCSDSRRSTRGYYIVKPFNYLGKLLPGIFAPACLNECTWLQSARVWVYTLLFHSPRLRILLVLAALLLLPESRAPRTRPGLSLALSPPPLPPPPHHYHHLLRDPRTVKTALNRSTICLAAWSN